MGGPGKSNRRGVAQDFARGSWYDDSWKCFSWSSVAPSLCSGRPAFSDIHCHIHRADSAIGGGSDQSPQDLTALAAARAPIVPERRFPTSYSPARRSISALPGHSKEAAGRACALHQVASIEQPVESALQVSARLHPAGFRCETEPRPPPTFACYPPPASKSSGAGEQRASGKAD